MPDIIVDDIKITVTRVRPEKAASFILLDRSGSMGLGWVETIGALNGYVAEIAKTLPDLEITLAAFDSMPALDFVVLRSGMKAKEWLPVTATEISPRGYTPLLDAVVRLFALAKSAAASKTSIVILTDGGENSSREAKLGTVKALIEEAKASEWDVTFIGADFNAFGEAGKIGVGAGQTLNASKSAMFGTMRAAAVRASAYSSGQVGANSAWSDEDRKRAAGNT